MNTRHTCCVICYDALVDQSAPLCHKHLHEFTDSPEAIWGLANNVMPRALMDWATRIILEAINGQK